MKGYEGGISYYTWGVVDIPFPENRVICRACPLFTTEYGTRRDYCRRTGEFIPDPDRMIGGMCPITFYNDQNEKENDDHVESK